MKNINKYFIVLTVFSLFFQTGCNTSIYDKIKYMEIEEIDFALLNDGKYKGEFVYSIYEFEVEATVNSAEVKKIKIIKGSDSYHGVKAREVLKRVIDKQSLDVDCVTGATNTSKAYLKAAERALKKAL